MPTPIQQIDTIREDFKVYLDELKENLSKLALYTKELEKKDPLACMEALITHKGFDELNSLISASEVKVKDLTKCHSQLLQVAENINQLTLQNEAQFVDQRFEKGEYQDA